MLGCGGGTQGPSRIPVSSTPPNSSPELRRVTRGMNGVSKRKRQEIEISDTESTELGHVERPRSSDQLTTTPDELTDVIAALKDLILQQSQTIEKIQTDLAEVKNQNGELREELKTVQAKLDAYSVSPPTTRSWASVAAGSTSTPSPTDSTFSYPTSSERPPKELCSVRISTKPPATETETTTFTRYLPTEAACTQIQDALSHSEPTKETRVAGVGTTKTGYIVRFPDEQSAKLARDNPEWLQGLGGGTKLVKPRFGVVFHRTPTEEVKMDEDKDDSIKKIMDENCLVSKGFKIEDIAWLKRQEKELGRSATLGIWFDTKEGADWVLYNGLVFGQKYVGSTEAYQTKKKLCHKCARRGHLARTCQEQSRCGFCAGNHERRDCPPGSIAKCLDCEGRHPTGNKQCQGPPPGAVTQ